jgi:hypothetical protein
MACNSLRQANWDSIRNMGGWKPFNGNLHLLLGGNSTIDNGGEKIWAKYLLGLDNNPATSIMASWYICGQYCHTASPVEFAVAGFSDCQQDMLTGTNAYTPQGGVFYDHHQVK